MAKISIIGAGSWGTALGLLLCSNGHDVTICSENENSKTFTTLNPFPFFIIILISLIFIHRKSHYFLNFTYFNRF